MPTKCAVKKPVKWVQLKIYSEWCTQMKELEIVSNKRYFDVLASVKREKDYLRAI